MVDPQASRFWRGALQSGLIDAATLQTCWDAIAEEKRTADAVDRRLARVAINAGHVTVWQVQQLLTGRVTGFKIDRYVLLDLIGQGGMGRVYLAKDTRLGRRVALKVLSKERMNNPRAITRFHREAKVGAQLQHENLVRFYDEGESNGIRYLVMEYIDGKNVGQLIGEQGAIPWPAAARLARQVALGLEHAYLKGLIHRDVNPCNILVTHDGTAKLTDLGLAIDLADEANVTRDGATVGTFDYISPEQAKHSRSVDTRSDIYSLGCTLYHMIAGRVPFPMPSLTEKLYAHQLHDADPLETVVSGVPEGLARVVRTMMRKLPEERYPTPLAVALALEPFADESARIDPMAPPATFVDGAAAPSPITRVAPAVRLAEATATPTPTPAVAVSDPDLAIFAVDTGPEVPLSATFTAPAKAKSKPRPSTDPEAGSVGGWRPSRPMIAAGIAAVVVLGGIATAVVVSRNRDKPRPGTPVVVNPSPGSRPTTKGTDPPKPEPARPPAIAVVSRDGTRPVATLAEAIAIATGGGGDVVLGSSSPIRLGATGEIRVIRGDLTIRAADGAAPVLAVEMAGGQPVVRVTSGASLTLRGVRVVAHYQAQVKQPLIQSGGRLVLDRCAFLASGETGGSRAVLVEGLNLWVDGCLFEGFDRTFDVEAFAGLEVAVHRSIIVRAGGSDRGLGWAFRLQHVAVSEAKLKTRTAPKPRHILIDHATISGGGLFELDGFSAASPLVVDLDHVAVQTRALLAWSPRTGQPHGDWSKGLKWTGKANRYDVTGPAWIVLSAAGELPMSEAPADLAAWSSAVKSDKDSTAQSFKFAADSSDLASIEPSQFALVGEGVQSVGADPKEVGPQVNRP